MTGWFENWVSGVTGFWSGTGRWLSDGVARLRHGRTPNKSHRLVPVPDGFELRSDGKILHSVRWEDVILIRTYKRDLVTFDSVQLAVTLVDGEAREYSEHTDGFMTVVDSMQARFPEIPADWYLAVMFPAFERNERILWSRVGGPTSVAEASPNC